MNATQVTINVKGKDDTISLDRLAKCLDNFDASQIPIPGTALLRRARERPTHVCAV